MTFSIEMRGWKFCINQATNIDDADNTEKRIDFSSFQLVFSCVVTESSWSWAFKDDVEWRGKKWNSNKRLLHNKSCVWKDMSTCNAMRRALLSLSQWQYHFIFGSRTIFFLLTQWIYLGGKICSICRRRLAWLCGMLEPCRRSKSQEEKFLSFFCRFCHPENNKNSTTEIRIRHRADRLSGTSRPRPIFAGSVCAQFRLLVILQHRK